MSSAGTANLKDRTLIAVIGDEVSFVDRLLLAIWQPTVSPSRTA